MNDLSVYDERFCFVFLFTFPLELTIVRVCGLGPPVHYISICLGLTCYMEGPSLTRKRQNLLLFGIIFSVSGNFKNAISNLCDKATKAFHCIKQYDIRNNIKLANTRAILNVIVFVSPV